MLTCYGLFDLSQTRSLNQTLTVFQLVSHEPGSHDFLIMLLNRYRVIVTVAGHRFKLKGNTSRFVQNSTLLTRKLTI